MSKGGPFNSVAGLRPRRHFFNLSHAKLFTLSCGELFPVLHIETLPGDKFKIGNNIVVRMQPLLAPILQTLKVYTEYFFVPNRLIWDDWTKFFDGAEDGSEYSGFPPRWNNVSVSQGDTYSLGSLADAVGLPIGVAIPKEDVPNGFVQRAYNLIWNEYYRDETIDPEVALYSDVVLYRRWKKDYFTSALPFPQRGTAQGLSWSLNQTISGRIPVYWPQNPTDFTDATGIVTASVGSYNVGDVVVPVGRLLGTPENIKNLAGTPFYAGAYSTSGDKPGTYGIPEAVAGTFPPGSPYGLSLSNLSIGFDISDFRKMVQVQKFLERNARAGVRYNEFLLAHYGISPRDSVLQRPEYIGGSRSNIVVSEVLQTSQTTTGSGGSPQGNLAGRGIGVSSEYISTYTASEPGYIIGLCSIMPNNLYDSQGIGKEWTRRNRYDYALPEFMHLSEQPVKNVEIFCSTSHSTNDTTFGYQPIYTEYRHMRSSVVRDFRVGQALESWTMARSFASTPTLSSNFLKCDPPIDRVIAVNTFAPFMVHFGNVIKAFRPLPVLGEPGLVDHF